MPANRLKTVLLNILILIGLLGLIEVFFQINRHEHWISPGPSPSLKEGHLLLKPAQVKEKYGIDPLQVPDDVRAEDNRNQDIRRLPGARAGRNDPPDYLTRLKAPLPQTLRVTRRLQEPYSDRIIFSVEYKMDSSRRRVVENQNPKKKSDRFYLALGASFTFGVGVNTGYDYPSQLAKIADPKWKIYNLGWPGNGPNDFLFRIQKKPEVLSDIKEAEGIAVWLFIPAQFERFLCAFDCYNDRMGNEFLRKPEYVMRDGKLQFSSLFKDSNSFKRKFYSFLAKSATIEFSGLKPFRSDYADDEVDLTAEGLLEVSKELKKNLPVKKFYVMFPGNFTERRRLTAALEKRGIEVVNFFEVSFPQYQNFFLPFDGHPSAGYYWLLSQLISQRILSDRTSL